jgi:hypothetical protein
MGKKKPASWAGWVETGVGYLLVEVSLIPAILKSISKAFL